MHFCALKGDYEADIFHFLSEYEVISINVFSIHVPSNNTLIFISSGSCLDELIEEW